MLGVWYNVVWNTASWECLQHACLLVCVCKVCVVVCFQLEAVVCRLKEQGEDGVDSGSLLELKNTLQELITVSEGVRRAPVHVCACCVCSCCVC